MKALKRETLGWLVWTTILVAAFALWVWHAASTPPPVRRVVLPYSAFRDELRAGHVVRVVISGHQIEGEMSQPVRGESAEGETTTARHFVTVVPELPDPTLLPELQAHHVEVVARRASPIATTWLPTLLSLLPFALLLLIGYLLLGRTPRGGPDVLRFGRSGARMYTPETTRVTFDDVAGAEGPKAELREIVEFLKDPAKFRRLGAEIPHGVLLIGPPGTGKTLLARAVAGEAGVPFFSITGSEFVEMFVGVGASRVRDLFRQAKAHRPCIIFVDEIDAIGRQRGVAGLTGAHEEREQTLNQLLAEMDGFEPNEGIIVLAATNRPDILDPALLRPGRFDRRVVVDLPTLSEREAILKLHARGKPLASDVDLRTIARGTPGFSGADLENLLNEAALLAARAGKNRIEREDLERARDKVMMGLERRSMIISPEERRCMAYHEAGHAVVAAVLPHADPLHKVTIVPRGRALGLTQQLPAEERHLYTREYLHDKLAVLMGGRAAEELVLGTATSGAENDLKEATRLARRMVLDWGLAEELGHQALRTAPEDLYLGNGFRRPPEYGPVTAEQVDRAVRRILDEAYERARETLKTERAGLDAVAEALMEHEVLSGEEVAEILARAHAGPQDGHRAADPRVESRMRSEEPDYTTTGIRT